MRTLLFIIIGYLGGSLLFARYFGKLFGKKDITADSTDKNPGTFNAFKYGGFLCGTLTLCCDLLKGFLPVFFYQYGNPYAGGLGLALVLAAPVCGHVLPIFHKFKGGKGIAVSFGCLLGMLPDVRPVLVLACVFLFFSLVINITPNYHKTFITYLFAILGMRLFVPNPAVSLGFAIAAVLVMLKLMFSTEKREPFKIKMGIVRKHGFHPVEHND